MIKNRSGDDLRVCHSSVINKDIVTGLLCVTVTGTGLLQAIPAAEEYGLCTSSHYGGTCPAQ